MDRDNPPAAPRSGAEPSVFHDLRARNERRRATRAAGAAGAERRHRIEQRIARVIEATRARARSQTPLESGRQPSAGSDRS